MIMMKSTCVSQFVVILAIVGIVKLVEPPYNVTILCHNGTNIAYWNHTGADSFLVTIENYNYGETLFQDHISRRHIDMSSVTPPKDDTYILSLKAKDGSNISDEVQVSFTYGSELISDVKCFMDFPRAVNVTVRTDQIMFSFDNPLILIDYYIDHDNDTDDDYYPENSDPDPDPDPKFHYKVYTTHDEKQLEFECPPEAPVCHGELQFINCTTLEIEGNIDHIRHKYSKDICNIVPEKGSWPIYLSLVIGIIAVVLLVFIFLCTRKLAIKTFLSSHLPESLKPREGGTSGVLQPENIGTGNTPLLQSPKDSPPETPAIILTPDDPAPDSCPEQTHFPIPARAPSSDDQPGHGYEARLKDNLEPDPQPEREHYEGSDDDGYMQRERITDTSESIHSSVIDIEIAPEDRVSGYGTR
ncbi:interferon gamma receptor 1-like [Sardina pilchardus]|uniref:interferon gamma receptor 1-like n=1 Tax=Sardina pilchardus TaxID=27697 RepID=UPI002E130FB5